MELVFVGSKVDELISIAQSSCWVTNKKRIKIMQILKIQMTLKALLSHNPIHELSTQVTVEQQAAAKENTKNTHELL